MAIQYTWNITRLEYYPSKDGFNKVINTVHWTYTATDEQYTSYVFGSKQLDTDNLDPNKHVEYDKMTEEVVIKWVTGSMGSAAVDELQAILRKNLNDQRAPINVIANPPWYQNPANTGEMVPPNPIPVGDSA